MFLYAGSSNQQASQRFVWCVHFSLLNLALQPNPQQKKSKKLSVEIQTALFV